MLRELLAPNPSPMTLAGTRTFLIGNHPVAVIDPGPDIASHGNAVAEAIGQAAAAVLLTHTHPDHAGGARGLAAALGCEVRSTADGTLTEGDVVETDAGAVVTIHSAGHTPDHACFHWPAAGAVFCGDLMMGGLDTALVAPPEGDLGAYLASLERLRALRPRVIHPAHGPDFTEPDAAIARYIRHRMDREAQVLRALADGPLDEDALVEAVYGGAVQPALRGAALGAVRAYLNHLREKQAVRPLAGGLWSVSNARPP